MKRVILVAALVAACSESRALESVGPGADAAVADAVLADAVVAAGDVPRVGADAAPSAGDVPEARDVVAAEDVGTALPGRVVINEVRGAGEDWIELYNAGGAAVDLAGYGITDSDTADGTTPRVADAVRFPSGTSLAPGAYLVVVADLANPGMGPQITCLMAGGPARCFHAGFGISASRGEVVHLLDPRDAPVDRAPYPADGDAGVRSGETLARLPNGVGAFGRGQPTPGAANRAP